MKGAESLTVSLGDRSYDIYFGTGGMDRVDSLVRTVGYLPSRIALVTDVNVEKEFGERAIKALSKLEVPVTKIVLDAGERTKSIEGLAGLYESFAKTRLDRQSLVLGLGGGVVGDLSGFAAATYLRGIPHFQVPTSLLAQVDSSVGGKTGINLPWGKNLVGAFHQPAGVLIDPQVLQSLPEVELRNGLSEVIKVAAIFDEDLFLTLEMEQDKILAKDTDVLLKVIRQAVKIKASVVERDEMESGVRMLLNFGHTVGHAIEACKGFETVRHGEAVAVGMAVAALLSVETHQCKPQTRDRLLKCLRQYGLPTNLPAGIIQDDLNEAMRQDKKRQGDALRFILMTSIGKGKVVENVNRAEIRKILAILS